MRTACAGSAVSLVFSYGVSDRYRARLYLVFDDRVSLHLSYGGISLSLCHSDNGCWVHLYSFADEVELQHCDWLLAPVDSSAYLILVDSGNLLQLPRGVPTLVNPIL